MPTNTTYLNMSLYNSTTDGSATFASWRAAIDGVSPTSNFNVLDTYAQNTSASITALQVKSFYLVPAVYVSPNYYEANSLTSITAYTTGMYLDIYLDTTNVGSVTLNINALGTKTLKKVDATGALVDLDSNDLEKNKEYLFRYNGTYFVWVAVSSGASTAYSGSALITISGSKISHTVSGVSPGTYTSANLTVDDYGHLTAVSNGASASSTGAPSDTPFLVSGSVSAGVTNAKQLVGGSCIVLTESGSTIIVASDYIPLSEISGSGVMSDTTGSIVKHNYSGVVAGSANKIQFDNFGHIVSASVIPVPQTATLTAGQALQTYDSTTGVFEKVSIPLSATGVSGKALYSYDASTGSFVNADVVMPGNVNTFTASNNNFQGTSANDLPTYSSEFLPSSGWTLGSGWSGSFVGGFTHASGSVVALTNSTAAVNATKYQIAYTVSGYSAGSFSIDFGGQTITGITATGAWGPTTTSTGSLVITPTSNFVGTVVFSIKSITAVSTALINLRNSAGTVANEIRSGNSNASIFIGVSSGRYNTTHLPNIGIGLNTLSNNTTGAYNVSIGQYSLSSNTVGSYNTSLGYHSLNANVSGRFNVSVGQYALSSNTTGEYNTVVGGAGLLSNILGSRNSGIGYNSLMNTVSSHNSAFGMNSGRSNTTGTYNTFVGTDSGYNASQKVDAINSMALGNGTYTTADNQVVIGNTDITQTLLRGSVGIGIASPTATLDVQGTSANDLPTYSAEFLDSANWTLGAGWSGDFVTGFIHASGTATLAHDHAAANATKYQISYTVTGRTVGSFNLSFGGQTIYSISASGAFGPTATNTDPLTITPTTDFDGTIVISIKSITNKRSPIFVLRNSSGDARFEILNIDEPTSFAIGRSAGAYATTSFGVAAVGAYALENLTTGNNNTAIGYSCGRQLTTGGYNVAIGNSSLYKSVNGNNNTGVGATTLYELLSGYRNTAVGYNAGRTITTGSDNTFIGHYAGYNASQKVNASNSMALGNGAYTTEDNQVVIGNTSITSTILHGSVTLDDAANLVLGTTTGTKIGTAANQKIGFFNVTPVVQRSHIADATDATNVITQFNSLLLALEQLGLLASA